MENEEECKNVGIILDYSKYDSAILGLLYDIDFIKISNKANMEEGINKMEQIRIKANSFISNV